MGLRGTCAVARVVLQLFDIKWKHRLAGLGITTWQVMRYVDDSRAILPPIRAGWRMNNGKLQFCKEWEQIDKEVSGEVRTKEILKETMGGIEDYLEFTVESERSFVRDGSPHLIPPSRWVSPIPSCISTMRKRLQPRPQSTRSRLWRRTSRSRSWLMM